MSKFIKQQHIELNMKYLWHLLAFGLPILIGLFVCISNGVYPFGDNCILHVDMYHQYCPYFSEFLHKLKTGGSLMYTWNEGLGSDFWTLYAYYLASPFNWLLILWPAKYIIEFMTLTILLKIGVAGLCFYVFLNYHYKSLSNQQKLLAIVFATAYALSGFVAAYSWDIMWMDVVALAPLVLSGLDRLVSENKVAIYVFSLTLCIWSNYYMAIMLCIFVAFYFLYLVIQTRCSLVTWLRFGFYSLLAGAACAALLIPEAIVLSYSGSSGFQFPKEMEWYFGLWDELARMNFMAKPYTGAEHYPNLYVGIFTVLLVLLYACNRNIARKRRIPAVGMVIFFGVSFANNKLDFLWHGLHFPDSLPGRQAYLFAFLLLTMGFAQILHYGSQRIAKICITGAIFYTVFGIGFYYSNKEITDEFSYILSGIFVACYLIIMVIYEMVDDNRKRMVVCLAFLLGLVELSSNIAYTGFSVTSRVYYMSKYDDYKQLLKTAQEASEDTFYRVEDPQRMTKNDCSLYGYASATEFSSLMNINVSHLYQSLYMEGGKNFYCYNGTTPLTSAMLSVKYLLFDSDQEENAYRKQIEKQGNQYLYENTYVLPLGYMISDAVKETLEQKVGDKVEQQNRLAAQLGAQTQLLKKTTCSETIEEGETQICFSESGYYYIYYDTCASDTLTMKTSKGRSRKYAKTTHKYLMELGDVDAKETVTISNSNQERISFEVYRLDPVAMEEAYATLAQNTMTLTQKSDTKIEGTIDVENAGNLILSIPCEQGWQLYVDGNKTELSSLAEAWISIPLQKGTHTIKLKYGTPGLLLGGRISLGAIVILVITMLYRKKRRR